MTVIAGFAGRRRMHLRYSSTLRVSGKASRQLTRALWKWLKTGAPTAPCANWKVVDHCRSKTSLIISGTGDVIEPEFDLMAKVQVRFCSAAARAFGEHNLSAREIVERSLNIAADFAFITNHNLRIEELDAEPTSKRIHR